MTEKQQEPPVMFQCRQCGQSFPASEMWEPDQCQMCHEAEYNEAWWRAVTL